MSHVEKQGIDNWGLSDGIIACSFDTISSNTGINRGGCIILQQILNKQLLWLSCNHHIPELILKAAYQSIFGKTNAPVETLCKTVKSPWKSPDFSELHFSTSLQLLLANALLWIPSLCYLMNDFFSRSWNISQEEATKNSLSWRTFVLLDLSRERNSTPTSYHDPEQRAMPRWISKCLYILKFSLL